MASAQGGAAYVRAENADSQLLALRVPPHSVEAEQSLLGALLLDNQAFDRVADLVTAEDFYRDDHRRGLSRRARAEYAERAQHPALCRAGARALGAAAPGAGRDRDRRVGAQ